MSKQEQLMLDGHESVSNALKEPRRQTVVVSEDPFEGERSQGTQASGYQAETEAGSGYKQMHAGSDRTSSEPRVVQNAPDTTSLRDIAEATFGTLLPGRNPLPYPVVEEKPPKPESVIDSDDRTQITNTADHPWRVHASLRITAADNSLWLGTAWFIGPHTLATAGHCVFIHAPGTPRHGWVRSIQVMPGRNVDVLPYGSVTSTNFRAASGWTQSPDENYDYAAIIIPTELGNMVGWFGLGIYSDSDLLASTVCVSGYPADKPAGTQWYHCRQVASVTASKVYYDLDTAGGQSGSAVYRVIDGDYYGVAIHAYGGATANSGTRIAQPVYDNLTAWKA